MADEGLLRPLFIPCPKPLPRGRAKEGLTREGINAGGWFGRGRWEGGHMHHDRRGVRALAEGTPL